MGRLPIRDRPHIKVLTTQHQPHSFHIPSVPAPPQYGPKTAGSGSLSRVIIPFLLRRNASAAWLTRPHHYTPRDSEATYNNELGYTGKNCTLANSRTSFKPPNTVAGIQAFFTSLVNVQFNLQKAIHTRIYPQWGSQKFKLRISKHPRPM